MTRRLLSVLLLAAFGCSVAGEPAAASGVWCNQVAIVGDSLTVLGNGALHATFPTAIVNARGGRVTSDGFEAGRGIAESNPVDCWVFALGTNDVQLHTPPAASAAAIAEMIGLVGPSSHAWWILPNFPTAGQFDPSAFDALVPSYVVKVDLHTLPADFTADGIHLTATGYIHRAAGIAAAIAA